MHTKPTKLALVVVVVASILALTTPRLPAQAMDQQTPPQPSGADGAQTIDDLFTAVARQQPGFGGMYVDADKGITYVYLRAGELDAVVAGLKAVFGDEYPSQNRVQILPAQFSFLELKQWHDRLAAQVVELPGVTLMDIDDAKNRLTVGVENLVAKALVEQQVAGLGIPTEAVTIVATGPLELATSLRDRHRPLVGGLQLSFRSNGNEFLCTLGFLAIRRGVEGFVTNSHCSAQPGTLDTTRYYQPEIADNNHIGEETVDPNFRPCGPGDLFLCRQSDSNFSPLTACSNADDNDDDNGNNNDCKDDKERVAADLGYIARPHLGSVAWDGQRTFRIVREAAPPVVGRAVTKVGRTTGRTEGRVIRTGVRVRWSLIGPRIWLYNQVFATYDLAPGDSGSPVISARAPDPDRNPVDTALQGITWGEFSDFPPVGPVAIYSPIQGVEAELGPLNTCAPPREC